MKESAMRKNANKAIDAESKRGPAKSWDEATGRVAASMAAKRNLELCDIFESMTDDERERLAAVPVCKTDLREVGDIRTKYGVSWKDLETLRRMAW